MDDLTGILLAMQTPFDSDAAIDWPRVDALVETYLAAGIHGLVLSSGTGQHAYLTEDECNRLFETGIAAVAGRVPVVAQTSALNLGEVVRRSRRAEALGAGALMVLPPYLEGPRDDDGLFAFYQAVAGAVGIDIIGYNIPSATQIEITPRLYERLLGIANFRYIKDSSGDLGKQQALMSVGGRLLNGSDTIAPFSLMAGAAGCIWGGANYMPREAVALYDHLTAGRLPEALALWRRMFPSLHYLWTHDYIPACKLAAEIMGYGGGPTRAPVRRIGAADEVELRAALAPLIEAAPAGGLIEAAQ